MIRFIAESSCKPFGRTSERMDVLNNIQRGVCRKTQNSMLTYYLTEAEEPGSQRFMDSK